MKQRIHVCGGASEYIRLTSPRPKSIRCTGRVDGRQCRRRTLDPHDPPKCSRHWKPRPTEEILAELKERSRRMPKVLRRVVADVEAGIRRRNR